MTQLVDMKDELQKFYIKNEYWLTPVLKALTAFLCFFMIRIRIGSDSMFGSLLIAIAAAALCSFLPWTAVTVMSAILCWAMPMARRWSSPFWRPSSSC